MSTPTLILSPLLALVLLGALIQFGRMARGWLAARHSDHSAVERRDRIALEDEKHRLMTTLSDLEFEHHMGKIGEQDYSELRATFEHRAVQVIEELEALT